MVDIRKVKEFINNNTEAKVMDIDTEKEEIEISNADAEDLDVIRNAGMESVLIRTDGMVFEVEDEPQFKEKYNQYVEKNKKI